MKPIHAVRGYYFITDSALSRRGIFSDCRNAVACGVAVVQYRAKDLPSRQMLDEALRLRAICAKALFLVNDRVDIALACGADGVHIGQEDLSCECSRRLLGSKAVIGVTVHSVKEALAAQRQGADYLAVSPVFATTTKKDAGRPAGLELVRAVRCRTRLPLVAIGGITLENAAHVIESGADAVCAISQVVAYIDVRSRIRAFQRLFPA